MGLKPCPFCGNKAQGPVETEIGDCRPERYYWIECTNTECHCQIDYFDCSAEAAMEAWNKRYEPPVPVYDVEEYYKDGGE